jgi:hypothetical protein
MAKITYGNNNVEHRDPRDPKSMGNKLWVIRNGKGQVVSKPTPNVQEAMKEATIKNNVLEEAGKIPEFEVKQYLAES